MRVDIDEGDYLMHLATQGIGDEVSEMDGRRIVECLLEKGIVEPREARLLSAAVSSKAFSAPMPIKDRLRAGILRQMIYALMQCRKEE
jgi:transcriptional regulator CtsR